MRPLGNFRSRRDEDVFGLLTITGSAPRIGSQPRCGFRAARHVEPMAFNYVSWTMFVVFFMIVFRGLLPYYISSHTLGPPSAGIAIGLYAEAVSKVPDEVAATVSQMPHPGAVETVIVVAKLRADGRMLLGDAAATVIHGCVEATERSAATLLRVDADDSATYSAFVDAIDTIVNNPETLDKCVLTYAPSGDAPSN